jgi:hypothetical protein
VFLPETFAMARVATPWFLAAAVSLALLPDARAQSAGSYGHHVSSPYWGYTSNPYDLHGAADLVRAQGEFLITKKQVDLMSEDVYQKKLESRRKKLEHEEWVREYQTGWWERQRERIQEVRARRSRNDPPVTEIYSARSLNDLLVDLRKRSDLGPAAAVTVDPDWLLHIHVTSGAGGNLGILKGEKVRWPLLLRHPAFEGKCGPIDQVLARVKQQIGKGEVSAKDVFELRRGVAELRTRVKEASRAAGNDAAWGPNTYINTKRFLQDLEEAFTMLENPDAAYFLNPPEGKTVGDLLQYMNKGGLRFAPATAGCERHYVALHQALAQASSLIAGPQENKANP